MADTRLWNGGETSVVQVNTETPNADPDTNDEYKITLSDPYGNSNQISFTVAGVETVKAVCDGLTAAAAAAKAAFTRPWTEVTVTDDDAIVTITADTAGIPFTAVTAVVDGGGAGVPTLTNAITTANVGQNDFLTPENYEDNTVPVSTDSLRVMSAAADSTKDIAGGDYSSILLADFDVDEGCFLSIGSKQVPLKLDADFVRFSGRGDSYLDITGNTSFRVDYAKARASGHSFGLHIMGATIALLILDPGDIGDIGVGVFDDAAATVTLLRAMSENVKLGEQLGLTTLHGNGATIDGNCAVSGVATLSAGTMIQRTGALAQMDLKGDAEMQYNSSSLPTTINLYNDAVLDLSGSNTPWASGTLNNYGGEIKDPHNLIDPSNMTINKFGPLNITN